MRPTQERQPLSMPWYEGARRGHGPRARRGARRQGRTNDFVGRALDLDSQSILEVVRGHLGRSHAYGLATRDALRAHDVRA